MKNKEETSRRSWGSLSPNLGLSFSAWPASLQRKTLAAHHAPKVSVPEALPIFPTASSRTSSVAIPVYQLTKL